jgi:ADP-dependent NAD(P)H-hydrate dehydratase / NAD(P)H-hydrate epimerase
MQRLVTASEWPVYTTKGIKCLERRLQAQSQTPLMQKAGLAAAHLANAIAPHAQRIWIAAGPGNNGGDGLETARQLHLSGKSVRVSLMVNPNKKAADAQAALDRALKAGVPVQNDLPSDWLALMSPQDLCIDALLGLGANRTQSPEVQNWINAINQSKAQVLALDVPTGLHPESGQWLSRSPTASAVQADHTLTFLAAKAGLFMGHGRDACGEIWCANLDDDGKDLQPPCSPQAWLNVPTEHRHRHHASHKGQHGDVAIIGGESMALHGMGMSGAAILAATAALHAGAGRVFLSLLGDCTNTLAPDLMQRPWTQLELEHLVVVCGCGGGQTVKTVLDDVLARSDHLVLDADGLNATAQEEAWAQALRQRGFQQTTVITPHPLEAARLLKKDTQHVQHHRLESAQALAETFNCVVVLKGSGTVITAPGQTPRINTSGCGKLAIGGTGDVLAGLIGARMAQGMSAWSAACSAVHQHGQLADTWPAQQALTAQRLAQALC